jgi:hypothetical protein
MIKPHSISCARASEPGWLPPSDAIRHIAGPSAHGRVAQTDNWTFIPAFRPGLRNVGPSGLEIGALPKRLLSPAVLSTRAHALRLRSCTGQPSHRRPRRATTSPLLLSAFGLPPCRLLPSAFCLLGSAFRFLLAAISLLGSSERGGRFQGGGRSFLRPPTAA